MQAVTTRRTTVPDAVLAIESRGVGLSATTTGVIEGVPAFSADRPTEFE